VPAEQRALAPAVGSWSVDGVVEHLAVIEGRIVGLLQAKVAEARSNGIGRETEESSVFATLGLDLLLMRLLDRSAKLKAAEAAQPKGQMTADAGWASLEGSRAQLQTLLRDMDGMACRNIIHPHPVLGPIDLYTWIGFVGAHEGRHAAQIREIGSLVAAL
jgi:hypothetical protein